MTQRAYQPIASSLIRSILVWASVCAVLFFLVEAGLSYFHVKQDLKDELQRIAATNVPLLAVNLWDIEPDAVQKQINTIASRQQIGLVKLSVITGQRFVAGDESLGSHGSVQRFQIDPPGNNKGTLGTLEIYANPSAFYRELGATISRAAVAYSILVLTICAVTAYVLKRHLERPLRQIAAFASALTAHNLTAVLEVDRPASSHSDEIDAVIEGFKTLQNELSRHVQHLDQLVLERTQALEAALASIHQLSCVDPLTQCLNRRAFDDNITQEIERAQRYGRPLSLVFCDIDHFKRINDNHGHAVGDQVLQAAANFFQSGIRIDVDWIARFGGEEFVMVMPETDERGAVTSTERLRLGLTQLKVALPGKMPLSVTASFGVAQYVAGESVDSLVQRADSMQYAAKRAGRNRTHPILTTDASPPPPCPPQTS